MSGFRSSPLVVTTAAYAGHCLRCFDMLRLILDRFRRYSIAGFVQVGVGLGPRVYRREGLLAGIPSTA
jgi:hypothetical protein